MGGAKRMDVIKDGDVVQADTETVREVRGYRAARATEAVFRALTCSSPATSAPALNPTLLALRTTWT